ncbi:HD domain-containing phosphohydrolase [Vibrio sp. HN007]|uniref:HD domain-containing phosphohydrolase n=1 Tax=Vibrio iocasae TaxID=3098914 RepID=UPI0035D4A6CB
MVDQVKRKVSIRVTVVAIFMLGTLATALIAIGLQYYFSSQIARQAVEESANQAAVETKDKIARIDRKAGHTVELLARNSSLIEDGIFDEQATFELFRNLLTNNNALYAAYIGLQNGDFYELINLESSPVIRSQIGASLTDRFAKIVVRNVDDKRVRETVLLDEYFSPTYKKSEPTEYNASSRPWFRIADDVSANKTEPYLFQHLQAPGQTYSMKLEGSDAVIAIDIALSTLSDFLSKEVTRGNVLASSEAYIFDSEGTLIATNLVATNSINTSYQKRQAAPLNLSIEERAYINRLNTIRISNERDWAPMDYSISGEPRGYVVELTQLIADRLGLSIEFVNGVSWSQLVEQFQERHIEVLTPVYRTDTNKSWGLYSEPLLDMTMVMATKEGERDYLSLKELIGKIIAIPAGWSVVPEIRQAYPEIKILEVGSIYHALQAVQQNKAIGALGSEVILNYNMDTYHITGLKVQPAIDLAPAKFDSSLRYVFHPEYKMLMALFNMALANLPEEDRNYLEDKWLKSSLQTGESNSRVVPYKELLPDKSSANAQPLSRELVLKGTSRLVYTAPVDTSGEQFIAILVSTDEVLQNSRRQVYISTGITIAVILLVIPFCWLLANPIVKPIRMLALENQKIMRRQYDLVEKREFVIKEIDELGISLVEMSEAIAEHELRQQKLMDSFVELIAQAIDDKSPYTGGHCHRVPVLGLMMAEEASQLKDDKFGEFSIDDKDSYREFKLAAWLHDCGKITTPEHVVDKGSKLESSYNRIHEIRTRFEVLWRDAQIACLENTIKHPENKEVYNKELDRAFEALRADYEFVAISNIGGEAMDDSSIKRLEDIANKTWMRHFSDRLGLSPVEEKRLSELDEMLPVTEHLLADKPEHLIPWEREPKYDPKFEIKLEPPKWQNNQGELYNLKTRKGTLNAEERFRINEHTVSTIKILEGLPFPPELSNVPKFASTHHETLKGTGYPRKLSAEDLSVGERILVLADVFEALTADDRPYKKAKSLSVAIDILYEFVQNEHIDPQVFELFLTSGIYLRYAKEYLLPEQIDEVDISAYL